MSPLYRLASLRFILRLSSSQFARSWLRTVPGGVGRSPRGGGRSPRWWRMVPGGGGRSPVVEDGPQWWMTVPGGGGRSLWWRTVYGGGGWFPARWWRTVPSGRGRSPVVVDGYRWFDLFKKSEVKILWHSPFTVRVALPKEVLLNFKHFINLGLKNCKMKWKWPDLGKKGR